MKVIIEFGSEEFVLTWKVINTQIARNWFEKIKSTLEFGIFEKNRFYNFPNQDNWSKDLIAHKINECMDVIEQEYYNFFKDTKRPNDKMSQDDLNYLHKFFTELRGSIDLPSHYYINASQLTKQAISDFNVLIHRFESYNSNRPRFVVTFNNEFLANIIDDDYSKFQLENQFGDMCLNYVQVGKQIIDAYRDNDLTVNEELRPMNTFGAAFNVKFYEIDKKLAENINQKIKDWYVSNNIENITGLDSSNPKLAIGWVPVARLDTTFSENEILKILSKNDYISNISLED
mgnify:FL=1